MADPHQPLDTATIYTLCLGGGDLAGGHAFRYVGRTKRSVFRRIAEHAAGGDRCAAWVRKHGLHEDPTMVLEDCVRDARPYEELRKTLELMRELGVPNVRGAQYAGVGLDDVQLAEIRRSVDADDGDGDVYVVKLGDAGGPSYYYVSRTTGGRCVWELLEEHEAMTTSTPAWIREHGLYPNYGEVLVRHIPNAPPLEVLRLTLELVDEHGIECVRGAQFQNPVLSERDVETIERARRSEHDECFRCGGTGHMARDCQASSESPTATTRTPPPSQPGRKKKTRAAMNGWGEEHGFHFQSEKPGAVLVTLDGPLKLSDGRIVTQTINKVGKQGRRVYHVTGEDGTTDLIPEATVRKLVAPSLNNEVCPLCGRKLRKKPQDAHRYYGCESWRKDDPQGSCWFKATMRAAD